MGPEPVSDPSEANSALPTLSPVARQLLSFAADDYTEVFALRSFLQRLTGPLSPEAEKQAALCTLHELLALDLVRIGDMRRDVKGLTYWEGPVPHLMARLDAAWNPSTPPGMGESPWLDATAQGKRLDATLRASS